MFKIKNKKTQKIKYISYKISEKLNSFILIAYSKETFAILKSLGLEIF